MQNTETKVVPFPVEAGAYNTPFERSVVKLWSFAEPIQRRAGLVGMIEAYTNCGNFSHLDDLILLMRVAADEPYAGRERRMAFVPLAKLQIAGNLLADICKHPEQYDADEIDDRVAGWNAISQRISQADDSLLRFCEKRR